MNFATHFEARILVFALCLRLMEVVPLVGGQFTLELLDPFTKCPAEPLLNICCSDYLRFTKLLYEHHLERGHQAETIKPFFLEAHAKIKQQ